MPFPRIEPGFHRPQRCVLTTILKWRTIVGKFKILFTTNMLLKSCDIIGDWCVFFSPTRKYGSIYISRQ